MKHSVSTDIKSAKVVPTEGRGRSAAGGRRRRPAGAERVGVPESNTCLPMPESTLVAAVRRDRVRRADGSTPTNGLQLGQQLDTAKEQSATQFTCRGIDENKCKHSLYLRRMSGRRSAPAPSNQRLGELCYGHDVTEAFGHTFSHYLRCPSPLRSTLQVGRYHGISRTLEPVDLTVCGRH